MRGLRGRGAPVVLPFVGRIAAALPFPLSFACALPLPLAGGRHGGGVGLIAARGGRRGRVR